MTTRRGCLSWHLVLFFYWFLVCAPLDVDDKIDALSREEWNLCFNSDALTLFDTEEKLHLTMKDLVGELTTKHCGAAIMI